MRSRTGAVVFSPSAKQLPPVINWLWALDSSVNYILLPSVSGWQYCWPYSCPAPGWRWYTWWSRWPWHCGVGRKRETLGHSGVPAPRHNSALQRLNPGVSIPVGCVSYMSMRLSQPFIEHPWKSLQPTRWGTAKARVVQGKRKFSTSYSLTQEVCNEVRVPGLPTRPLSLKLFPLEAMSFWWDQVLFLLLEKTRHFWNTCYFKEALREKPISTIVMPVGCRIWEGKIPYFFPPQNFSWSYRTCLKGWEGKKKTKQKKPTHFCCFQITSLFVKNSTFGNGGWTKMSESFLILPKNLQICFPDH